MLCPAQVPKSPIYNKLGVNSGTDTFGPLEPCGSATPGAAQPPQQDGSSSTSIAVVVGASVGGVVALCCKSFPAGARQRLFL